MQRQRGGDKKIEGASQDVQKERKRWRKRREKEGTTGCTQVESEGRERGGCKQGERWRKRRERRHCGMYKRRER